jgi:hypothetical protein
VGSWVGAKIGVCDGNAAEEGIWPCKFTRVVKEGERLRLQVAGAISFRVTVIKGGGARLNITYDRSPKDTRETGPAAEGTSHRRTKVKPE